MAEIIIPESKKAKHKPVLGITATSRRELAVSTKYPGWELDEQNQALWTQFWAYLLPHIPIENLGLYIALTFIIIFEVSKTVGYMHYVA